MLAKPAPSTLQTPLPPSPRVSSTGTYQKVHYRTDSLSRIPRKFPNSPAPKQPQDS